MKSSLTAIALLTSILGFGQNISTEAPSVSASAVTVPAGFLQAELSVGVDINNDFAPNVFRDFEAPFLLARFGLSERFELRMQSRNILGFSGSNVNFDLEQLGIGLKYAILPNNGNTNLAIIGTFLPFAGNWQSRQGDLTFAFSQSIGESSSIGVNIGGSFFDSNLLGAGTPWQTTSLLGSAVYSYQLGDKFTAFGEFYYSLVNVEFDDIASSTSLYGIDFGLQFLLRENIQIDYVSGFNLSNRRQFHSLGFNIYFKTR